MLAALHTPAGDRAELQLRDDGVAGNNIALHSSSENILHAHTKHFRS